MHTTTLVLILAAAIVALALAVFQYYYKTKKSRKLSVVLTLLRFLALFGLFMLLINPSFSSYEYHLEKTNLVVLVDNSSSMVGDTAEVFDALKRIRNSNGLSERFALQRYQFGNEVRPFRDSLSLTEKNTNIQKALAAIAEIYTATNTTVLFVSDGNQTIGNDYAFQGENLDFPVYPIVIGDTTRYEDLRIDQINVNKYAFLKNKYPVEVFVSYEGSASVRSDLTITINGIPVYRENLKLSSTDNSKVISTFLEASTVGVKSIKVSLQPLENEKNKANNEKPVAIEVIDEKTNVVIVSDMAHPDIGTLKKAIESNEQRAVVIQKPTAQRSAFEEVDIFILYQPNATFKPIFDLIKQKKGSSFILAGNKTDWTFLNAMEPEIQVEDGYPNQEIAPVVNPSFSKFDISDVTMNDFPPLESDAGSIQMKGDADVLMSMMIRGRIMQTPLLLAKEGVYGKKVYLFGENVWKWRMQSFRNDRNFETFDNLMGKLMLYLSDNTAKTRLNIEYERIYDGAREAKITATYFDEAFVFDTNASILLKVSGKETNFYKEIPMLLKNGFYEASLLGFPAAAYDFTVSVAEENRSKSGTFTIADFDVERQFLSSDYKKLNQLAHATKGRLFYPSEIDALLENLMTSERFVPTRKGTKNVVSLIDFRILMALIVIVLALEWFIRKYNGLI